MSKIDEAGREEIPTGVNPELSSTSFSFHLLLSIVSQRTTFCLVY